MRLRRSSFSMGPNMLAGGPCHRLGRHSMLALNRQALTASRQSKPWSSKAALPRVWQLRRPFSVKLGPTRESHRPPVLKKGQVATAAKLVQLQ